MAGRELRVTVLGDSKGAQKALGDLNSHAEKTESRFGKLGGTFAGFGKAAALGLAGAGAAAGGFLAKAVMGASDLAETMSKVGVVFGDQANQVTSFANQMAKDFGLPKGAILDAASSIGLIGKASGLSQGDAAKMSTQLGKLAADASSFYNVPLPEALQAIQSGLVGEAEPMRRFGVLLNEEAVNAEAARLGLEKRGKEFTEGAKAQARASLIMSGMKDASGDLERTQGSLSNRMRELRGRFENFTTSVGEKVVPVVLKLFDGLEKVGSSSAFKNAMKDIGDAAREVWARVQEAWPQIKATVLNAVEAIVGWVREHWPEIKKIITETMTTVQTIIKGVVDTVQTIWENFGSQIKSVIGAAWDYVKSTVQAALDVIQGIVKVVTGIIKGDWGQVWEGIKQILSGVWDFIVARIQLGIDLAKAILSTGWEIVKSIFSEAWDGIKDLVRRGAANIVDIFLGMAGSIINAAASAFGWMPVIGDDIRRAARAFEEFRDRTNAALRGTDSEKTVNVYFNEHHRRFYEDIRGKAPYVGSMHTGGIVPGRGDVPMILEGGEGVFTPEQMAVLGASMAGRGGRGGGGGTVTIGPGAIVVYALDPKQAALELRDELISYGRRVPGLGLN